MVTQGAETQLIKHKCYHFVWIVRRWCPVAEAVQVDCSTVLARCWQNSGHWTDSVISWPIKFDCQQTAEDGGQRECHPHSCPNYCNLKWLFSITVRSLIPFWNDTNTITQHLLWTVIASCATVLMQFFLLFPATVVQVSLICELLLYSNILREKECENFTWLRCVEKAVATRLVQFHCNHWLRGHSPLVEDCHRLSMDEIFWGCRWESARLLPHRLAAHTHRHIAKYCSHMPLLPLSGRLCFTWHLSVCLSVCLLATSLKNYLKTLMPS